MPRFFFHIEHRDGPARLAVDEEADKFVDVEAARAHALSFVRRMIAQDRLTLIRDWMVCSFEVADEARNHVLTGQFSDTVMNEHSLS